MSHKFKYVPLLVLLTVVLALVLGTPRSAATQTVEWPHDLKDHLGDIQELEPVGLIRYPTIISYETPWSHLRVIDPCQEFPQDPDLREWTDGCHSLGLLPGRDFESEGDNPHGGYIHGQSVNGEVIDADLNLVDYDHGVFLLWVKRPSGNWEQIFVPKMGDGDHQVVPLGLFTDFIIDTNDSMGFAPAIKMDQTVTPTVPMTTITATPGTETATPEITVTPTEPPPVTVTSTPAPEYLRYHPLVWHQITEGIIELPEECEAWPPETIPPQEEYVQGDTLEQVAFEKIEANMWYPDVLFIVNGEIDEDTDLPTEGAWIAFRDLWPNQGDSPGGGTYTVLFSEPMYLDRLDVADYDRDTYLVFVLRQNGEWELLELLPTGNDTVKEFESLGIVLGIKVIKNDSGAERLCLRAVVPGPAPMPSTPTPTPIVQP